MDTQTVDRFLGTLWKNGEQGYLALFRQQQGHHHTADCKETHTRFYNVQTERTKLIKASLTMATRDQEQVYYSVALFNTKQRIEENTAAVPGFWADIDIAKPNTPATEGDALAFLNNLPLRPTLLVWTGHGIHAYWLLNQPWVFATDADRQVAADYSERWQLGINALAKSNGWEFDTTGDLPRILRLPGTLNWKDTPPLPVEVLQWDGPRYDITDFKPYLAEPAPDQKDYQKTGERIKGGRHKFLISWAGRQHASGLDFDATLASLLSLNERRCDPPLDEEDVASSLERVWSNWDKRRAKDKQKKTEAPLHQFPIAVFPQPITVFIKEAARTFDSDPAMVGLPILATLSAAIGGARYLLVKKDWEEYCVIFGAVVSIPGTKKTPIQKRALKPLYLDELKHQRVYKQQKTQYDIDMATWDAMRPQQRQQLGLIKPVKPIMKRRLISDITMEKLADILMENSAGVLQELDELSALIRGFNQYKGGDGSDRSNFLSMWNAGTIRVDRRNREEPVIIPRTFLSVIGGIQPDLLNEIADRKGRSDGMMERFLFVDPILPKRRIWNRDEEISEEAEAAYTAVVDKLLNLPMAPRMQMDDSDPFASDQGDEDLPTGQPVWFASSGEDEWARLYQAHMDETDTMPYHLRVAYVKLDNYAARLTLIIHLARWAANETASFEVEGESVRRAFILLEYFKAQTRQIFAALSTTPEDKSLDALWKWLQEHSEEVITLRYLMQCHVAGIKKREQAVPLLRRLLDNGDIAIVSGELDKPGSPLSFRLAFHSSA